MSHPAIDIEKATNGADADEATGPEILVGDPVTWTYVVTNVGDVDLTSVEVTDDLEGDICTIGDLAVGESKECTASGTAALGQYENDGTATGFYPELEQEVTDTDPSHYLGIELPPPPPPADPSIDIEKYTNGEDSDASPGEELDKDDVVTWSYVVTNTGNTDLTGVVVTDDKEGDVCIIGDLAIGESKTCEKTGSAILDIYANVGTVVGYDGETKVMDTDPSHYFVQQALGTAQLGDTVWYDANKNGVQDNGEDGINGAKVTLKDGDGNVIATATTATGAWNGFYKFLELDAGTYTATLDMSSVKSTYELTTAGAITVTIVDGDDYVDADFGLGEPEEELPKTGLDSEELALIAFSLLALGTLAVLATRRSGLEER